METPNETEIKEQEPRNRNVILYFVRHGDACYANRQDMAGFLSEKGQEQAREAGRVLYKELPKSAVVEFISSNLNRAKETSDGMREEIEKLNNDPQVSKGVIIHHGKYVQGENRRSEDTRTYQRLAISDEHTQEFFRLSRDEEGNPQDAVKVWLENPNKNVVEMESNFRHFIHHFNRFSHHVSPGPDVYVVLTVHGGASDVAIGRLLGESSLGQLKNCEAFKISLLADGQTTLTLRGTTRNVSV